MVHAGPCAALIIVVMLPSKSDFCMIAQHRLEFSLAAANCLDPVIRNESYRDVRRLVPGKHLQLALAPSIQSTQRWGYPKGDLSLFPCFCAVLNASNRSACESMAINAVRLRSLHPQLSQIVKKTLHCYILKY